MILASLSSGVLVNPAIASPEPCTIADIAVIGGTAAEPGGPDGQLTVDDIIVFVNSFSDGAGCPGSTPCNVADITGIGGPPEGPDGQLTVDDIIAFVNLYGDGCVEMHTPFWRIAGVDKYPTNRLLLPGAPVSEPTSGPVDLVLLTDVGTITNQQQADEAKRPIGALQIIDSYPMFATFPQMNSAGFEVTSGAETVNVGLTTSGHYVLASLTKPSGEVMTVFGTVVEIGVFMDATQTALGQSGWSRVSSFNPIDASAQDHARVGQKFLDLNIPTAISPDSPPPPPPAGTGATECQLAWALMAMAKQTHALRKAQCDDMMGGRELFDGCVAGGAIGGTLGALLPAIGCIAGGLVWGLLCGGNPVCAYLGCVYGSVISVPAAPGLGIVAGCAAFTIDTIAKYGECVTDADSQYRKQIADILSRYPGCFAWE